MTILTSVMKVHADNEIESGPSPGLLWGNVNCLPILILSLGDREARAPPSRDMGPLTVNGVQENRYLQAQWPGLSGGLGKWRCLWLLLQRRKNLAKLDAWRGIVDGICLGNSGLNQVQQVSLLYFSELLYIHVYCNCSRRKLGIQRFPNCVAHGTPVFPLRTSNGMGVPWNVLWKMLMKPKLLENGS